MYIHRPLEDKDLEHICTFPQTEEELFYMFPRAYYPLMPEQLLEVARSRHDSTVVIADGCVAGYGNFIEVKQGDYCSIGNIITEPSARKKGVASYLIRVFVDMAFQRYSANYVRISCFNNNTPGLLLYHKLHFRPAELEERRTLDGGRVALIHMHLCRRDNYKAPYI